MAEGQIRIDFARVQEAKASLTGAAGSVQTGLTNLAQAEPEAEAHIKALMDLNAQINGALTALSRAQSTMQASLSRLVTAGTEVESGLDTITRRVFPAMQEGTAGRGSMQFQGFLGEWHSKVDPLDASVKTMGTTSRQLEGLLGQLHQTTASLEREFEQVLQTSKHLLTELQQTKQQLQLHEHDLQDSIPTLQRWVDGVMSEDHL